MINNIEQIKKFLIFDKPNDFYMLCLMKRVKDQPIEEYDTYQSDKIINTFCISSIKHLEQLYDEVIQLCEILKVRAYIHVQKQNHADVSLDMMTNLANRIKNGNLNQKNLFNLTMNQIKPQDKRWIVDIDTKDGRTIFEIEAAVNMCRPEGNKIEFTIPTKNGVHLITNRFDDVAFKKQYPEINVLKKNPTLLYYPDSIDAI